MLFTYVRTQSVIAQSSCEAEWYGIATSSSEGMFLAELFGRLCAGKLRSLECKTLWVQTAIKKKNM